MIEEKPKKQRKRNYVNNPQMYEEIVKYRERLKNNPNERIPNYIGECIKRISDNLAKKPNFSGYSFIEDMKGDALENCFMYFHSFNPEKSQNPFAYFTQIIKFAFIRRIQKEKKHSYVKHKMFDDIMVDLQMNNESEYSQTSKNNYDREKLQDLYDSIEKPKKKIVKEDSGLDKFIDD